LLSITLGRGEYEILMAEDGSQAWQILGERRPDLAVLDLAMPGRNGLELVQATRQEPALGDTKILVLTGWSNRETENAARACGADAFFTKPFSPLKIIEAVEALIGGAPAA